MKPWLARPPAVVAALDAAPSALVTSDGQRIADMTRYEIERALLVEWVPARRHTLFARSAMLREES